MTNIVISNGYYKMVNIGRMMKSFFQLEKPMKSVFLLYAR